MGSRELRPAEVGSARMGSYTEWAYANLVAAPGQQADPDLCRQSYLMWCSDLFQKPEPRSKQRAAIKAAGGRAKGVGKELTYLDIALLPPLTGQGVPHHVLAAALVALRDVGLITPQQALDAALDLA